MKPQRAVRIEIVVEADTMEDALMTLDDCVEYATKGGVDLVRGGVTCSAHTVIKKRDVSNEQYFQELHAYLATLPKAIS